MNVVEHRTPRPPIDLNPRRAQPAAAADAGFSYSPAEVDRIWRITRQVAEGVNAAPVVVTDGELVEWWDPA